MCRWRPIILVLICITLAGGCKSMRNWWRKKPPEPVDIPPTTRIAEEQPLVMPPSPTLPVKRGTLPLVYLLEHPGEVRVIDATAGVVLIGTRAGGRTILAIDEENGVTIGGRTIHAGPLESSHVYEVYLTNSTQNTRSSVFERR